MSWLGCARRVLRHISTTEPFAQVRRPRVDDAAHEQDRSGVGVGCRQAVEPRSIVSSIDAPSGLRVDSVP